ncbi:hypothetical protein T484DRAFT_1918205, partial [Baffinella frigidus]
MERGEEADEVARAQGRKRSHQDLSSPGGSMASGQGLPLQQVNGRVSLLDTSCEATHQRLGSFTSSEREERAGKQRKVSDSDQIVPNLPPLPNVKNERGRDAGQLQPRSLPPQAGGRDTAADSVVDLTKGDDDVVDDEEELAVEDEMEVGEKVAAKREREVVHGAEKLAAHDKKVGGKGGEDGMQVKGEGGGGDGVE